MKKGLITIGLILILLLSGCEKKTVDISYNEIVAPSGLFQLLDEKEKIDAALNCEVSEIGPDMYAYRNNGDSLCGVRYSAYRDGGDYVATWIQIDDKSIKTYCDISVGDTWTDAYKKIADDKANSNLDNVREYEPIGDNTTYCVAFEDGERISEDLLNGLNTNCKDSWIIINYEVSNNIIRSIAVDDGAPM